MTDTLEYDSRLEEENVTEALEYDSRLEEENVTETVSLSHVP